MKRAVVGRLSLMTALFGAGGSNVARFPQIIADAMQRIEPTEDFIKTDPDDFGLNELGYAFGKVTIKGKLRVSYKKTSATTIQVGSVEVIGAFDDLYDFAYGGGDRAKQASIVQAGHATLAGTTDPDSGKVFFTKVEFNGGWANTWNGNY